ncbi:MAG: proline dehydrogenase family protein [Tetrasphaera sp.]
MVPSRRWRTAVRRLTAAERVAYYLEASESGRFLVQRYVAGSDATAAVAAAAELRLTNRSAALAYLAPAPHSGAESDAIVAAYADALSRLRESGLAAHGRAEITVRPAQLGLGLEAGATAAGERLRRLVRAAAEADTTVSLDLDDPARAAAALDLAAAANADPHLGVTVRADLQRTVRDVRRLSQPGARLRLLRGELAGAEGGYRRGGTVDRAYVRCVRELLTRDCYPIFATADLRLIEITAALARQLGRPNETFEFELPYGVRVEEQRRIADRGHQLRVWIPWGREWHDYLAGRLAERHTGVWQLARALAKRG